MQTRYAARSSDYLTGVPHLHLQHMTDVPSTKRMMFHPTPCPSYSKVLHAKCCSKLCLLRSHCGIKHLFWFASETKSLPASSCAVILMHSALLLLSIRFKKIGGLAASLGSEWKERQQAYQVPNRLEKLHLCCRCQRASCCIHT